MDLQHLQMKYSSRGFQLTSHSSIRMLSSIISFFFLIFLFLQQSTGALPTCYLPADLVFSPSIHKNLGIIFKGWTFPKTSETWNLLFMFEWCHFGYIRRGIQRMNLQLVYRTSMCCLQRIMAFLFVRLSHSLIFSG